MLVPQLRPVFLGLLICLSFSVHAAPTLKTGIYVREGGSGTLTLKADTQGGLTFSLDAVGVNAHTCGMEGKIQDGKALMKDEMDGRICIVTFTPQQNGIDVQGRDEDSGDEAGACRYYCGMRASFSGLYLTPPSGCAPPEIKQARQEFQRFYDGKAYKKALSTLKPVLDNCQSVLHELYEEGGIRNDLAVTYHKLGDYQACYAILAPYAEDVVLRDDEIDAYSYAPMEREVYLSTISAARVNLPLCKRAEKTSMPKTTR